MKGGFFMQQTWKTFISQVQEGRFPVALYGAGGSASLFLQRMRQSKVDVVCFCDSDEQKIGTYIEQIPVISLENCNQRYSDCRFFISVLDNSHQEAIKQRLMNYGIPEVRIYANNLSDPADLRHFCAQYHIDAMDDYFDEAEEEKSLQVFWGENTPFYQMFRELNLQSVVELACGRGRHVPQYINLAEHITLVDILEKNIDFCKKRFPQYDHITYYANNGSDLSKLKDNWYTALFTYDAMVHFESIDVYYYLQETARILKTGGRALFHHSNNTFDYKQSFSNSISSGRSYMSAQLFAHYAHRAGLTVLKQQIIDWAIPELDCITLVEK